MTTLYLDTSALVKRYLVELGSGWIIAATAPDAGASIVISELAQVEAAAAFAARHCATTGISRAERDTAINLLAAHCTNEYILVATNATIIDRAIRLTQEHRLRGYDALQLATAVFVNQQLQAVAHEELRFVCADNDLVAAAQAEGLATDNPTLFADS